MRRLVRILVAILAILALVVMAAYLVLRRDDIPFATLEAKYGGAQSHFIDLPGGVHLHYRDQGNPAGPPIVLVHGFSASLHAWEPWVARLGDQYRVITLDLPGHGLTRTPPGFAASITGYSDIVDTLATALKTGPYVVGGNSMGGGVAWHVALRHGASVRGLVLVDSAGWPQGSRNGGNGPLIFKILASPIGRALIRDLDTSAMAKDGLKKAYVDQSLVTPALVDRYVELSRAPGHRDILLSIGRDDDQITPETFKAIHTPTLVMHGDSDVLIPLAAGKSLASAIPGAQLIVYPGVGHVPMEQIPDRSALDLKAFLSALKP